MPAVVAAVIDHGAAAWAPFLREYSGFMLGCIRRLSSDHDQRMDMYLHVCARLFEDDCRSRLASSPDLFNAQDDTPIGAGIAGDNFDAWRVASEFGEIDAARRRAAAHAVKPDLGGRIHSAAIVIIAAATSGVFFTLPTGSVISRAPRSSVT